MSRRSKMDWDRVHTEDRFRKYKSTHTDDDMSIRRRKRSSKKKKRSRRRVKGTLPRMRGCTCGKRRGYKGPHAQLCALMVKVARHSQKPEILVLPKAQAGKFWKPSFLKYDQNPQA
jgi:hypothetical protein